MDPFYLSCYNKYLNISLFLLNKKIAFIFIYFIFFILYLFWLLGFFWFSVWRYVFDLIFACFEFPSSIWYKKYLFHINFTRKSSLSLQFFHLQTYYGLYFFLMSFWFSILMVNLQPLLSLSSPLIKNGKYFVYLRVPFFNFFFLSLFVFLGYRV